MGCINVKTKSFQNLDRKDMTENRLEHQSLSISMAKTKSIAKMSMKKPQRTISHEEYDISINNKENAMSNSQYIQNIVKLTQKSLPHDITDDDEENVSDKPMLENIMRNNMPFKFMEEQKRVQEPVMVLNSESVSETDEDDSLHWNKRNLFYVSVLPEKRYKNMRVYKVSGLFG